MRRVRDVIDATVLAGDAADRCIVRSTGYCPSATTSTRYDMRHATILVLGCLCGATWCTLRMSIAGRLGSRFTYIESAMDTADQLQLSRDVRTLAWYAARTGKLPPNCKIFELIEKLDAAPSPPTELIAQLQAEMDAVSRAIAPMTLRHLLQRGSIVGHIRHILSSITPFALGLLTLLLTLYLAFQSSQLNQADTAVREYQAWADQQPREKLYNAWKMYRYERVLNLKGPPLAQLDAYHKLEDDARQLVDKGTAIQSMLIESGTLLYVPRFLENVGPASLRNVFRSLNGSAPSEIDIPKDLPAAPGVALLNNVQHSTVGSVASSIPSADCKDSVLTSDVKFDSSTSRQQPTDIDSYTNSVDCFLARLHISEVTVSYSPWMDIYQIKAKINLLVTWLLPGLYGLLGACVFLLRDWVLSRDHGLNQDRRIFSMLLLLLRIALGGLAGIIIGWFWIPAPVGNANSAVLPISSVPFGLAFMAGFSIDTLFSLLERVNKTIESKDFATRLSPQGDSKNHQSVRSNKVGN